MISQPSLLFRCRKRPRTAAAVVILPGGGYSHLADVKEGSNVARWLNSLGISAFVVKYRTYSASATISRSRFSTRARRWLRLVRSRAKEWNVDPSRIGILGFSAGGHLHRRSGHTSTPASLTQRTRSTALARGLT